MRCVGVAEIRFIKYFRDEGMGKSVKNMVVEESRGGGGALPGCQRACHAVAAAAAASPATCTLRRTPPARLHNPTAVPFLSRAATRSGSAAASGDLPSRVPDRPASGGGARTI